MRDRKHRLDREGAEAMALSGLAFLAEDGPRLGRFLALTGIGPDELRSEAGSPATLAAVLDHLLRDETLLLVFASSRNLDPETVAPAHALLVHEAEQ